MRGFVVGTIITAIAFYLLTRFLPQYVHLRRRPDRPARPVGHLRGRQRAHRADRQGLRAASHDHDHGPHRLRDQRRSVVAHRGHRRRCQIQPDGRRLPADPVVGHHLVAAIVGSLVMSLVVTAVRLVVKRLTRTRSSRRRSALAAGRFGTPLYATDLAALDAAAGAVRDAFPDPWLRAFRSRPTTCRRSSRRSPGTASRRTWSRAASGPPRTRPAPERPDHARGDRQDPGRPAGRGPGRAAMGAAALDRHRIARGGRRAGGARPARRGRAALDVLYRLNPDVAPETLAGLAVGAGVSKFGMTETEIGDAHRGRRRPGRAAPLARIHLHVGSQLGAVDAWRDAVRRALAVTALWRRHDRDLRHARRGRRLPRLRRSASPAPSPERFAREIPELLEAIPPTGARPAGHRTGPRARRPLGLARGARPARPRTRRPPGRHRCRHDRADPAGAVRSRVIRSWRPDLARAAVRWTAADGTEVGADPRRGPDLRIDRLARRPTTCRRCAAATSWPSPTPARTASRNRRPTTAGRARRRSCIEADGIASGRRRSP